VYIGVKLHCDGAGSIGLLALGWITSIGAAFGDLESKRLALHFQSFIDLSKGVKRHGYNEIQ